MTRPAQVVMIDDHPLLTHALAFTLRSRGVACTVPTLTDRQTLVTEVHALHPDVVLLDLDLGDLGDGSTLVPDLVRYGAAVLVVSASRDTEQVGRALMCGASGYIPKDRPLDELVESVLATVRGEAVMDPEHRAALIAQARAASRGRQAVQRPLESLSPREAHVLRGLMEGGSVREIAASSHVSETTVRTQVRAVLAKLGVSSQREAVAFAARAAWR